jgi:PAS domain S-box-containing protein
MMLDRDWNLIEANDRYLEATGQPREKLIGSYIFDIFSFETSGRREVFEQAIAKAFLGEANVLVRKPFKTVKSGHPGEWNEVYWTCHHIPVRNNDGEIIAIIQKALDVTDEVNAEKLRDAVVREFDHRIKNMLAKVTAIARKTAAFHPDIDDFLHVFDERILAMARTQDLLTQNGWKSTTMADLLALELQPFLEPGQKQVHVTGPHVSITGRIAQTLGLAFHELLTNAAKYGGLVSADDRLDIGWAYEDEGPSAKLVIRWQESFSMTHSPPKSKGFGTSILEQLTPYELKGSVSRTFREDGMDCIITIPRSQLEAEPDKICS